MCGEAIKLDSDMIGNILEGSRYILAVFFLVWVLRLAAKPPIAYIEQ